MKHKLRIDYDEATNKLVVRHQCETKLLNHDIRWSNEVELDNPDALIEVLKLVIDANRSQVEKTTLEGAVQHMAALTGKVRNQTKGLRIDREMKPTGEAE